MEGDSGCPVCKGDYEISIHALRVEGDISYRDQVLNHPCISIHALRVEGDEVTAEVDARKLADFYPRPPGGGRPVR